MELDIEFHCADCWKVNINRKYPERYKQDVWDNLNEALEHIKENPTHKIIAKSEFSI